MKKKKNKKTTKHKKILIISIFLLLIYIIIKTFSLYYYKYNFHNELNLNYQEITIKTTTKNQNKKYKHLNINIPEEFKYNDHRSKQEQVKIDWYIKDYNEKETEFSYITISKYEMNIEEFIEEGGVRKVNYNNVLKKNKINNELDLIEYNLKHQTEENIFTPISTMKMNHLAECYMHYTIPGYKKMYKLDGKINGYLYETTSRDNNYYVQLIYKNEIYILFFNNTSKEQYFTLENVIEILESIYFE